MAENGRLSASELSPIPGGQLSHDAADAWNAPGGPADHGCRPGGPDSSYRTYERQVFWRNHWCSLGQCGNAAIPGTSNHGNGTAVDDPVTKNQEWLLKHGAKYGWNKTEAFSEPWHFTYTGGGHVKLRRGDKGDWVRHYRNRLKQLGYLLPGNTAGFGSLMERRVKKFQKRHGLKQTGVIDGQTAYRINESLRRKGK